MVSNNSFNVSYVARSCLDYRIPVLAALDELLQRRFHYIYSADYVPERVIGKLHQTLGNRAIAMRGEWRLLGPNKNYGHANSMVRVVYQPGLFNKISETKPDVIVGDGFFQWTAINLLHGLAHKTPVVVCYERWAHTERRAQWYRKVYRKIVLRLVSAMACNGSLSKSYSIKIGMNESNITTGQMVADTHSLFQKVQKLSRADISSLRDQLKTQKLVFLSVCRLMRMKGINELLSGWRIFEIKYPGMCSLVIVGDGPERKNLEQLARINHLQDVIFTGHVDYDEIAKYYAAADVFVIPTLEDNWSLVVPEAMACGLPILCSKYNGCYPEMIAEGKNGWIFDPKNDSAILQVLETSLIRHQDGTLKQMGYCSRDIVASYTPEHAAASIYNACEIALHSYNNQ
jgi:glycosyltransferase involved in cell wall biosynthesis